MSQAEWRITDGDRHSAVSALGEHYAAGRLDQAEFDERSEQAYAAKTNQDLRPLFADLPAPHGAGAQPVTGPVVTAPAYRRRRGPIGFPVPLVPLVLLVVFVGLHFFWLFPLLFLGFWLVRGHRRGYGPGHQQWRTGRY